MVREKEIHQHRKDEHISLGLKKLEVQGAMARIFWFKIFRCSLDSTRFT